MVIGSCADDLNLLVLKNEITHYCELASCTNPTWAVAVEPIRAWHSRFGIPPVWTIDQGSHFKTAVVEEPMQNPLKSANCVIVQVLIVISPEYIVGTHVRTFSYLFYKPILNHTPRTSVELYSGLPLPSPLESIQSMRKPVIPGCDRLRASDDITMINSQISTGRNFTTVGRLSSTLRG
ncbi:Hypothetical protein PHPALM_19805 [Phytophthora palmivora]|uniref:Integrase catalytic domain-containing protein n=1 Tax=Phytophthora palmivora TaxID=4796 RepID=A0A2P4XGG3_9STRA|nr:Hypothetical protein PHPALM_19805 [Phytophthora palmivora]